MIDGVRTASLTASICLVLSTFSNGQDAESGRFSVPVAADGTILVALDFDNDGRDDLGLLGSDFVKVYHRTPRGFDEVSEWAPGLSPLQIAAEDLDGDGFADLVVGNFGSRSLSLAYGDGSGRFAVTELRMDSGVRSFSLGDVDGNGSVDIASGGGSEGRAAVLFSGGDRSFPSRVELETPLKFPHVVLTGDVNGDSHADVAIWARDTEEPYFVIYEGQNDRLFREVPVSSELLNPASRFDINGVVADFDKDGKDDIVLFAPAAPPGALLSVRAAEDGGYRVGTLGTGLTARSFVSLIATDLDGDDWLDLVSLGGERSDVIWLLTNQADGTFAFREPCGLFLRDTARSVTSGDFDGDGAPDIGVLLTTDPVVVEVILSPLRQCGLAGECFAGVNPCYETVDSSERFLVDRVATGYFGEAEDRHVLSVGNGWAHFHRMSSAGLEETARLQVPVAVGGVAAHDLDGDGLADFAVSDLASGTIDLFFLRSPAVLHSPVRRLEAGLVPAGLLANDIDQDGVVDLVVALTGSDQIRIFFGHGGGAFSSGEMIEGPSGVSRLAAGDVDGDGLPEIAASGNGLAEVFIYRGQGSRLFTNPLRTRVLEGARDVRMADLDLDGRDEIAVVSDQVAGVTLLDYEEGRFRVEILNLPRRELPTSLELADINGDDFVDVVIASSGARRLRVSLAAGPGVFPNAGEIVPLCEEGVEQSALSLAVGDMNGDHLTDLIVGDRGGRRLTVFRSSGCGAPRFRRGDADRNGSVNVTDAVVLLDRLFVGGAAVECEDAADVDDDGTLNLTDPVALLGYLFAAGTAPPEPGLTCGVDQTKDSLRKCGGACP